MTLGIAKAPDALTLFETASEVLRRRVPFEAALWHASDPATGLATSPMRAENLGEDGCATYWDAELLREKVNLFRDLARASVPVAALRASTGDSPEHSATYRRFMRPRGLDDELRAVFRTDGQWWGQLSLYRAGGQAPFTAAEVAQVAELTSLLGRRLRSFAEPAPPPNSAKARGVLLFDSAGTLLSINDEARDFLAGLSPGAQAPSSFGVPIPAWIHSTAASAGVLADESVRIRARSQDGHWLVFHATCMRNADGAPTQTAVVIEPAKASDVASLLIAAYGLTVRELEITQLIGRGLSSAQLAGKLFVSQHTVHDHVKAIFGKTGVKSRGELVAKLYTEHIRPLNPGSRVRVWDR